jgi:DNA-binding response OmpR family regulator
MKKNILVIDDDQDLGRLVETVLKSEKFNIHHAYTGSEGLRQTYQVRPDLIILDVMMPDMDGFTVCARLRECG